MLDVTLRRTKGNRLTHDEVDDNFLRLAQSVRSPMLIALDGRTDYTLSEAQLAGQFLEFTGPLTADFTVYVPEIFGYRIEVLNSTTGNYKLKLQLASGQIVPLRRGQVSGVIYTNSLYSISSLGQHSCIGTNAGVGWGRDSDNSTDTDDVTLLSVTIPGYTLRESDGYNFTLDWQATNSATTKYLRTKLVQGAKSYTFAQGTLTTGSTQSAAARFSNTGSYTAQLGLAISGSYVLMDIDTTQNFDVVIACAWSANVVGENILLRRAYITGQGGNDIFNLL